MRFDSDGGSEVEPSALKVGVGVFKTITIPDVTRVTVEVPSVLLADVLDGGRIRLVGLDAGRTTLVAWKSNSVKERFVVSAIHDHGIGHPVVQDVRTLLGDMEGVVVRDIGERIYIDGTTQTPADAERVANVVANYPGLIDLTKPSAKAQPVLTKLNHALAAAGFRNVTVNLVGHTFFLEGSIESEEDRVRAEAIVKAVLASPE